jgi:hypothetical protein
MPFGKYENFKACVLDNQDKENPEAYCAEIEKKMTGNWADHLCVNASLANYAVREAELEGQTHFVVPITILTEGVHCGSAGCYLYRADLLKRDPGQWNGMALPLDHPADAKGPLSANSPETINERNLGRLFNVAFVGKSLKGEAWIHKARLQKLEPELFKKIQRREPIEISTGLHPMEIGNGGIWSGDEYIGDIQSYRPDHVAILPPGIKGACSIEDGCGIRNQEKVEAQKEDKLKKKEEIVNALIACSRTQWGEDDRPTLMGMDEAVLNKMAVKEAAPPPPAPAPKVEEPPKPTANRAEDFIKAAPADVQEFIRAGLAMQTARRVVLVNSIKTVEGNRLTDEQLAAMPIEHLEGMAVLIEQTKKAAAPVHNYAGAPGVIPPVPGQTDLPPLTAPTMADIIPLRNAAGK